MKIKKAEIGATFDGAPNLDPDLILDLPRNA